MPGASPVVQLILVISRAVQLILDKVVTTAFEIVQFFLDRDISQDRVGDKLNLEKDVLVSSTAFQFFLALTVSEDSWAVQLILETKI
jgi:hypothetical protein